MDLDNYYTLGKELSNAPPAPEVKIKGVSFETLHENAFKKRINEIPTMTEQQLTELIKGTLDEIVNDILRENVVYSELFKDEKFIAAFFRVVSSIRCNIEIKTACNKLAYDYFTFEGNDERLRPLYMSIVKIVDQVDIINLMALGLDELTACNLAFCRFGSSREQTNVKRLNFSICFRDPEIMTEQMIVWIYEKLFNSITDLFEGTMFEVYNYEELDDFGNSFMEVYGAIGLAVLTILNNMTTSQIRKVLISYQADWRYHGYPPVRFSLRNISNDFSRIVKVIEQLESVENIIIP